MKSADHRIRPTLRSLVQSVEIARNLRSACLCLCTILFSFAVIQPSVVLAQSVPGLMDEAGGSVSSSGGGGEAGNFVGSSAGNAQSFSGGGYGGNFPAGGQYQQQLQNMQNQQMQQLQQLQNMPNQPVTLSGTATGIQMPPQGKQKQKQPRNGRGAMQGLQGLTNGLRSTLGSGMGMMSQFRGMGGGGGGSGSGNGQGRGTNNGLGMNNGFNGQGVNGQNVNGQGLNSSDASTANAFREQWWARHGRPAPTENGGN
jgi:hypothetical protein